MRGQGGAADRGVSDQSDADARRRGWLPDPVVVLAQDEAGLANLRALSSLGFIESDPAAPQVSVRAICSIILAGLVLLTGGTRGPLVSVAGGRAAGGGGGAVWGSWPRGSRGGA